MHTKRLGDARAASAVEMLGSCTREEARSAKQRGCQTALARPRDWLRWG